jgi:SET family sugar efflux transporter-like MFS transporter
MRRFMIPATSLLWGLQFALLNPVIGLLLVNLYGATPADVGWALMVYNIAGFVSSLVLPTWADRRREYLVPTLTAGVLTLVLAVVLWLVSSLPLAVAALVVLGGPAGMGVGLLMAHLRHAGYTRQQIVSTRSYVSFAWIAGPPIATLVMGQWGNAAILPTLALVAVGNIAVTWMMIREHRTLVATQATKPPESTDPVPVVTIGAVALAVVMLQAANVATVSVLGLYVTENLGLDLRWAGIALALAAGLEIPALIVIGRLSLRFSSISLLIAGATLGGLYYVGLAVLQGLVPLLALQVLNATSVAITSGIALTWFQEVLARPGLATTISTNVRRVGGIVAGPVIAVAGASSLTYVAVWWVCAVMLVVSIGLMAAGALLARRTVRGPQPVAEG